MEQLKLIEEVLKWQSFLDIAIITLGLFFIYRTFRTLGTWKIVLGLLSAIALSVVAKILDLEGIGWIFSNLSSVAVIGFIVLFQPEIRKFFERAVSLRRNTVGKEGPQMSSLLSEAMYELANLRYGAILVIPGRESVKAWASEGVSLKAEPSIPLILSIFDPNSPGHDGALIFERGKLTAFGVHLPLSTTKTLSSEYGTRHHAGLGLSEVTDSLVIVVSEERGQTTVFKKGQVIPTKNKGELASEIVLHWKSTASYPFPKKGAFHKRVPAAEIAVSLISALLFYYHVVVIQGEPRVKSFTVPVEYTLTQKHLVLSEAPSKIELRLSGHASELDRISTSQIGVRI
ncbi:MAG TPA: diadenylate cyclase [Thermodesulfovibrionia bacterium]|nr:diadenylate cyclase [Thermodesulfovibrionia bacterium]